MIKDRNLIQQNRVWIIVLKTIAVKQLLILALTILTTASISAQADSNETQSFKEGIAKLHETIDTIDIHRIFDQFDQRFQEYRPSDEEINDMKSGLSSALDKMEDIDFEQFQAQLTEMLGQLEEVFGELDLDKEEKPTPADSKLKKI